MLFPVAALGQEAPPQPPVYAEHVVAPGETLSEIAQQYGLTTAELMAANDIQDPDAVYADQMLRIPGGVGDAAGSADPQAAPPVTPTPVSIYSLNHFIKK